MVKFNRILSNESTQWFVLNGLDIGTAHEFKDNTFGLTLKGVILDCDGCPLCESYEKRAVQNVLDDLGTDYYEN